MDTETTSNTRHCDGCAVLLTDENHGFFQWRDRCNRCHSRLELDDALLEIADVANQFYKSDDQVINLQHDLAVTRLRVQELKRPIEDGGDPRLAHIWSTLWDALAGDVERDETWGLFIDAIAGDVPEFRARTFAVEIPLETLTLEVEAKDEDEAIELAIQQAQDDYSIEDVIYQPYIEVSEV
jgi:hypothetical protein